MLSNHFFVSSAVFPIISSLEPDVSSTYIVFMFISSMVSVLYFGFISKFMLSVICFLFSCFISSAFASFGCNSFFSVFIILLGVSSLVGMLAKLLFFLMCVCGFGFGNSHNESWLFSNGIFMSIFPLFMSTAFILYSSPLYIYPAGTLNGFI